MTAALEGGEWSALRSGRTLPPGETRYPFYRRLGGSQVRSGVAENLVPTGIRSRTAQPVVSRYTDWATRPTTLSLTRWIQPTNSQHSSFLDANTLQVILSESLDVWREDTREKDCELEGSKHSLNSSALTTTIFISYSFSQIFEVVTFSTNWLIIYYYYYYYY